MRDDLLQSAISFLSSSKVQSAAHEKKVQFLKDKGLDDEEIEEAFKRVKSITATGNSDSNQVQSTPKLPPRPTSIYQPIQVVYYPPAPKMRITNKQLLGCALVLGVCVFGITVTLTTIIKKCMSRVFQKIAYYQRDRYQQQTQRLSRMDSILESFTIDNPALRKEQDILNLSLDQLVKSLDMIKEKTQPYKILRSKVERLRIALVQDPISNHGIGTRASDAFGPYSGFASSYADRYKVDTMHHSTIQSIKSEIRSVKGMLLSRRNFPIVGTAAPVNIPPPPTVYSQNVYHPRRKQSFRSELSNPQSTTVEEVKEGSNQ